MNQDTYQFQLIQEELIQQLQSFSIVHGQYPDRNLNVVINAIPLLPLLKGQNIAIQQDPNLYRVFTGKIKNKIKHSPASGQLRN